MISNYPTSMKLTTFLIRFLHFPSSISCVNLKLERSIHSIPKVNCFLPVKAHVTCWNGSNDRASNDYLQRKAMHYRSPQLEMDRLFWFGILWNVWRKCWARSTSLSYVCCGWKLRLHGCDMRSVYIRNLAKSPQSFLIGLCEPLELS